MPYTFKQTGEAKAGVTIEFQHSANVSSKITVSVFSFVGSGMPQIQKHTLNHIALFSNYIWICEYCVNSDIIDQTIKKVENYFC